MLNHQSPKGKIVSENTSSTTRSILRGLILLIHRYVGLFLAVFLLLTGITGSILVWEQELDIALNPDLLLNQTTQQHLPPDRLLQRLNDQYPNVAFGFTLLHRDQQRSAVIYVTNWQDDEDETIDQLFVDRATAQVLGGRNSFTPSFTSRKEFIPWVMKFHWSLTLSWGAKLLGIVALLWLLDCFFAWYLTLPRKKFSWRKWKLSWQIKPKRLNYDLHRALSLWLLPIFLVLAISSVYFNLNDEVFKPLLKTFADVTTKPYEDPSLMRSNYNPDINFTQGLDIARAELDKRGIVETGVAYLSYNANAGYYFFGFYSTDDIARDTTGVQVYLRPDGELLQFYQVSAGKLGDIIMDWQFALHSGQALGLPGRLLIFVSGVAISIVSVTGIIIWWRKKNIRRSTRSKATIKQPPASFDKLQSPDSDNKIEVS